MALTVTVGGASSDSYITLSEWQTYWTARGIDLTAHGHDSSHEANLRQAADWIDRTYDFAGYRQYETQRRAWPRVTELYVDGWYVDTDTIPQDIKDAQAELAYLIHEGLAPWATITGVVSSTRSKAGPVETETTYQGGKGAPRIVVLEGLLGPYLGKGRGSGGYGQVRMLRG